MIVVRDPGELQRIAHDSMVAGNTIGLVPTMGALHEGHLSLIRRGVGECDLVVVSVFVNPAQFGPGEDLERYPRALEQDALLAEQEGASILFTPAADSLYPPGFQNYVEVGPLADRLCGASRPGHFRGVATIVLKLLNLSHAAKAYFGEKDYQQLRVIEQMVSDLNVPVEVVRMPTVRESDGLAMSSRNRYLSREERRAALVLKRSLDAAAGLWAQGLRDPVRLREAAMALVEAEPLARADYIEVADAKTLEPAGSGSAAVVIALAVFIGATRLLDNTELRR